MKQRNLVKPELQVAFHRANGVFQLIFYLLYLIGKCLGMFRGIDPILFCGFGNLRFKIIGGISKCAHTFAHPPRDIRNFVSTKNHHYYK